MSSKRELNAQHDTDSAKVEKPEILKNWKIKTFIFLLCALSFYAGWKASRSYLVKECHLAGAMVTIEDGTVFCQKP